MKQSKLFNLLRGLTRKEFKRLENYSSSPFNIKKRKDLPLLYKALKKFHPNFESKDLMKEVLFEKVYPKQDFDGSKFRNLLTDFVKIIENYLLLLETELNSFEKNKQLLAIYKRRNIHNEFLRTTNELKKSLNKSNQKDANYYYNQYLLENNLYFHPTTPRNEQAITLLKSSLHNFEHYFVLERGKLGIDLKNRERIYEEYSNFKIDDFSQVIPSNNYIYQLYSNSLMLIDTKDENIFNKTKKLYLEKIDSLGKNDKVIFFKILQNFIIQQERNDKKEYISILNDFFKIGIEKKILFENGKINSTTIINIIGSLLKNDEKDLAKSFLDKHKHQIEEETQGFTFTLSSAIIAFYEKKYAQVIHIFYKANFPNTLHHYGFKTLYIRACFFLVLKDTAYYDMFLSQCNSFEKYLIRDKKMESNRVKIHINFIKFIRPLGKLIFDGKFTEAIRSKLLLKLKHDEQILYKKWLIEILQNL